MSSTERNKTSEYIVYETILQAGSQYVWLWVAIEAENAQILSQNMTYARNLLIAEGILSGAV